MHHIFCKILCFFLAMLFNNWTARPSERVNIKQIVNELRIVDCDTILLLCGTIKITISWCYFGVSEFLFCLCIFVHSIYFIRVPLMWMTFAAMMMLMIMTIPLLLLLSLPPTTMAVDYLNWQSNVQRTDKMTKIKTNANTIIFIFILQLWQAKQRILSAIVFLNMNIIE